MALKNYTSITTTTTTILYYLNTMSCTVLLKKLSDSAPDPGSAPSRRKLLREQGGCNIPSLLFFKEYGEKARGSRGEQMDL